MSIQLTERTRVMGAPLRDVQVKVNLSCLQTLRGTNLADVSSGASRCYLLQDSNCRCELGEGVIIMNRVPLDECLR